MNLNLSRVDVIGGRGRRAPGAMEEDGGLADAMGNLESYWSAELGFRHTGTPSIWMVWIKTTPRCIMPTTLYDAWQKQPPL